MKILVTGPNGFIGSHLLKVMSDAGDEIIAVVKDTKENISSIQNLPGVRIVYCEMAEIATLPEKVTDRDIALCVHLAWAGSSGEGRADYALQLQNVQFALDTVKVLPQMNIKRFVGAGTLAEKDVMNYIPTDGATPNAVSIYGSAKIATHYMTKALCTSLGIEHIWCRLSNTYGVGNTTNNFVNMASRNMLFGGSLKFTPGEQMYDFVYITDTVRAIYAAATKGKANTCYYLGSTKPRKLKEYIYQIRDVINTDLQLEVGALPFNGISLPEEEYATQKLVNDTGFTPQVPFEEGIRMTVEWLKTL